MVRVIVLPGVDENTTSTLKKMRPAPSYYVILAAYEQLMTLFSKVRYRLSVRLRKLLNIYIAQDTFTWSIFKLTSHLPLWLCELTQQL